jgi:hypothetical protein
MQGAPECALFVPYLSQTIGNEYARTRIKMTMILYKTEQTQTVVSQLAHSFNQRARDSSSLERTKEKAMIHRSKDGLNRGFSFCFIELFWPDFATFLRQIQKCESKSRGQ